MDDQSIIKSEWVADWPFGCVVRKVTHSSMDGTEAFSTVSVYNKDGHYVGDEKTAFRLIRLFKINPELAAPHHKACSIGWCEHDGHWYGWSHRAMAGFKIGSQIKKGDCAYQPDSAEAFKAREIEFWLSDDLKSGWMESPEVIESFGADGKLGLFLTATYTNKVPNQKLHGTRYTHFSLSPKQWGRGEWAVTTLDEAKQAAIDFADSVG